MSASAKAISSAEVKKEYCFDKKECKEYLLKFKIIPNLVNYY
jgi:hypothetical protein